MPLRLSEEELADLKQKTGIAKEFSDTFNSDAGRKVLKFLRKRFYLERTTLPEQEELAAIDPIKMAIREGMRTVVLFIQDLTEFDLTAAWSLIRTEESSKEGDQEKQP